MGIGEFAFEQDASRFLPVPRGLAENRRQSLPAATFLGAGLSGCIVTPGW